MSLRDREPGCVQVALVVIVLAVFAVWGLDRVTSKPHTDPGKVVGHVYHPAWVQVVVISTGKTTTFSTIHHPERWCLVVTAHDKNYDVDVAHDYYDRVRDGANVESTHLTNGIFGFDQGMTGTAVVMSAETALR